jgi:glutathione S-transferase
MAFTSRTPDADLTLYRLHACPYCERIVRKLQEYDLDYQSRYVTPEHSTRNVVKRVSGSRTVPALIDRTTGLTMSESANIVKYLDRKYGEGA